MEAPVNQDDRVYQPALLSVEQQSANFKQEFEAKTAPTKPPRQTETDREVLSWVSKMQERAQQGELFQEEKTNGS